LALKSAGKRQSTTPERSRVFLLITVTQYDHTSSFEQQVFSAMAYVKTGHQSQFPWVIVNALP
jgi:predicted membrane metal-binding protein